MPATGAHHGRESWSYGFQRWWLEKGLHRGIVTINGRWPDQPRHIYSFLNPSLSEAEAQEGREIGKGKDLKFPLNFLFVGRVEAAKGVGRLLQVAAELKKHDLPLSFIWWETVQRGRPSKAGAGNMGLIHG